MPKLKISSNRRFLVYEDGSPFYWFGDTAWELFHRSTREDAERYLEKRNSILICAKTGISIRRRPGRGFLLITQRRRSNRFSTVNPYMKITRSVLDQSIMDTLTRMISDAFWPFVLDPTKLSGEVLQFWWFDPRNGRNIDLGTLPRARRFEITPPSVGENHWVLVCDDASKPYLPPGMGKLDDRRDRSGIKPLPD